MNNSNKIVSIRLGILNILEIKKKNLHFQEGVPKTYARRNKSFTNILIKV